MKNALAKTAPLNNAGLLALCLADSARMMGGTSGALYNIFFTAAAGQLLFQVVSSCRSPNIPQYGSEPSLADAEQI